MIDTAIEGRITDTNGDTLPGVTVTLINPDTQVQTVRVTDARGEFRFIDLQPDTYNLIAELPGFTPFKRDGITLHGHETITLDITLQVAMVSDV